MGKVIHIDGTGGGSGQGYIGVFANYTALTTAYPTAPLYSLAYVENSQGTAWLPFSWGGTFYSKGTYVWNGSEWDSSVDDIANALELRELLSNKATDFTIKNDTLYPTVQAVENEIIGYLAGLSNYYFYKTVSDIGSPYYDAEITASGGATQTLTFAGVVDGDTVGTFATKLGYPNIMLLPSGLIKLRLYLENTGSGGSKSMQVYAEIYKRSSGGTETLLTTSGLTPIIAITGVTAQYNISAILINDVNFLTTDRVVVKLKATVTGGGSAPDLILSMEDNTASRVELPISNVDLSSYAKKTIQVTSQTLVAANWTLVSGLYEYNLANANITALNFVEVIPDNATISITKAADLLPTNVSSSGSVKLYSTNLPTGDIVVTINIYE